MMDALITTPQAEVRGGDDLMAPLHVPGDAVTHWSTVNAGEALPGVATPLSASLWARYTDLAARESTFSIGVFSRRERHQPPLGPDWMFTMFYGRLTMRMEWLATIGNRMPGTTGEESVAGILGEPPSTMRFASTRRRYPMIACRLPYAALVYPRRVRRLAPVVKAWWRRQLAALEGADLAQTVAIFEDACHWYGRTITAHATALFAGITPVVSALNALVERAGVGDIGVLSGTGGAEMKMVEDIWRASRGELSIDVIIADHGFHGPLEGEISSRVWREDPAPVVAMIERYASRDDSYSPVAREQAARERLPAMQAELAAAMPLATRPAVAALLHRAAKTIPLRGVGKASFLQALDVVRASSRRIGELLVVDGQLERPDDIFYLTESEIAGTPPANAKELISARRQQRTEYESLQLPLYWQGSPEPSRMAPVVGAESDRPVMISGIGASSGIVEGPVRVVTDASFAEVQPGEVLVAPTTDPSWASIMFVSAALVVDMGSQLSHAAVVARELGLPCVVNTRTGTSELHDGDVVRVDGSRGTVEVVKR
jgi:phosphohistidine swiveling domain-containing protein